MHLRSEFAQIYTRLAGSMPRRTVISPITGGLEDMGIRFSGSPKPKPRHWINLDRKSSDMQRIFYELDQDELELVGILSGKEGALSYAAHPCGSLGGPLPVITVFLDKDLEASSQGLVKSIKTEIAAKKAQGRFYETPVAFEWVDHSTAEYVSLFNYLANCRMKQEPRIKGYKAMAAGQSVRGHIVYVEGIEFVNPVRELVEEWKASGILKSITTPIAVRVYDKDPVVQTLLGLRRNSDK